MRAVAAHSRRPSGEELVGDPSQRDGDAQGVGARSEVIGVIYEARPNVRSTCLPLCAKAGSATVLRVATGQPTPIAQPWISYAASLRPWGTDIVTLLPSDRQGYSRRDAQAVGMIDVVIPAQVWRLIDFVRDTAVVPVIETGAGCHTYVHSSAMLEKARDIVLMREHAPCQRMQRP